MDGAPSNVKEGVTKEEADQVKAQLEEAGGLVTRQVARGPARGDAPRGPLGWRGGPGGV